MNRLISIIGLFLLFSCGNKSCETTEEPSTPRNVEVIEVDGCEYVTIDNGYKGGCSIIHKYSCKFCAKRNKTEEK